MRLLLIIQTDCILCEVLADTQQKLGYLIIFLFTEKLQEVYIFLYGTSTGNNTRHHSYETYENFDIPMFTK